MRPFSPLSFFLETLLRLASRWFSFSLVSDRSFLITLVDSSLNHYDPSNLSTIVECVFLSSRCLFVPFALLQSSEFKRPSGMEWFFSVEPSEFRETLSSADKHQRRLLFILGRSTDRVPQTELASLLSFGGTSVRKKTFFDAPKR